MAGLTATLADSGISVIKTVFVSLVACLVYLAIRLVLRVKRLKSLLKDVPGPERHWLYGTMHLLPKTSQDRIMFGLSNCNKYKGYYAWWVGGAHATLTVCHPETIKKALKTSEPKPTGFFGVYRLALPWLGEGLLIAGGQKWARSRRLLTPAFHFDILKPYMDVYNDAADVLIKNLSKYADKGTSFEVFNYVCKNTLDIILRCAFSYEIDCQAEGMAHPYVTAVNSIADLWTKRARRPWLYLDFIYYMTANGKKFRQDCDYVHKVAEDIIQKRKATLEENGEVNKDRKYLDFLDILLTARDENGEGLNQLEIRNEVDTFLFEEKTQTSQLLQELSDQGLLSLPINEVDTFLFEGHDTTASAISWILYSLATHPEFQKKCQEEIDAILDHRDSNTIEWLDLPRLEYLTMCIKEGMRMHSPVPFIQRQFTHDFEVDGKIFPAGMTVSLPIFGIHHSKHLWDKPMEYIPDRFSKENIVNIDSYQFVPFSAGPRNCIGQHFAMNEEKVVLARLLREYWFELDTSVEVRYRVMAVMKTENGMYLYAKQRRYN